MIASDNTNTDSVSCLRNRRPRTPCHEALATPAEPGGASGTQLRVLRADTGPGRAHLRSVVARLEELRRLTSRAREVRGGELAFLRLARVEDVAMSGAPGPGAVADVKTTAALGVVGGLTDALIFGRIAGARAAARIRRRASPSS